MAEPLDEVLEWYRTAVDALAITEHAVLRAVPGAIVERHASLHGETESAAMAKLAASRIGLAQVAVVALTAVFERILRDRLVGIAGTVVRGSTDSEERLHAQVRSELADDIEFWNISSRVLGVFTVDGRLRELVMQVINYRNWVAHGHSIARPPPARIDPIAAHDRFSRFLIAAGFSEPASSPTSG